jgi:hypothetical protein
VFADRVENLFDQLCDPVGAVKLTNSLVGEEFALREA